MKFFNCLIIALIFTTIIACEKDNPKIDIRGDWYTIQYLSYPLDSLTDNNIDFEYREDYIEDSLIFTYFSSLGYTNPSKFYIKQDSLFSAFGIENRTYEYKGRVKMVSNNHFIFYDDLFSVSYYRLTNTSELLSENIVKLNSHNPKFIDSDFTFANAFQKRSNELYFKIKDTIYK